jgi:hypothetical protein
MADGDDANELARLRRELAEARADLERTRREAEAWRAQAEEARRGIELALAEADLSGTAARGPAAGRTDEEPAGGADHR